MSDSVLGPDAGTVAKSALRESAEVTGRLAEEAIDEIVRAAELVAEALQRGGAVYFLGNGGSAADAQHLAGELVGRFAEERRAFRALALTTDTSVLTAVGNDYGFDEIFARQVEALVDEGDCVVGLSTSGESANVVKALEIARALGARTVALTGEAGGAAARAADVPIKVRATTSWRIQEAHIAAGHVICRLVEAALTDQAV
jgi:D-sedoheptulose 7-phosphate isomerase